MGIKDLKQFLTKHFAEVYDNFLLMAFVGQVVQKLGISDETSEQDLKVVVIHIPQSLVKKEESSIEVFIKSQGIKLIIFDDRAKDVLIFDDDEYCCEENTEIK